MKNSFTNFFKEDKGAVTVDWVVLTAALVGLGLAVMSVVSAGVQNLSNDIKLQLETDMIGASFGSNGLDYSGS